MELRAEAAVCLLTHLCISICGGHRYNIIAWRFIFINLSVVVTSTKKYWRISVPNNGEDKYFIGSSGQWGITKVV